MSNKKETDTLTACLEHGIEAVQRIVDCWKSGNLAEAVNQAEDWAVNSADLLPDPEPWPSGPDDWDWLSIRDHFATLSDCLRTGEALIPPDDPRELAAELHSIANWINNSKP